MGRRYMTRNHDNEIRKTIESVMTDKAVHMEFQVAAYVELMKKIDADIRDNSHLSIVTRLAYERYYDMVSAKLSINWRNKYFETMNKYLCATEEVKNGLTLEKLMNEVGQDRDSNQPSFISKLFHTVNNAEPIYDSKVRIFLEIGDVSGETVEDRKASAIKSYEKKIRAFYENDVKYGSLRSLMLNVFNEMCGSEYGQNEMTNTKRLDFVCWALGKQNVRISELGVEAP